MEWALPFRSLTKGLPMTLSTTKQATILELSIVSLKVTIETMGRVLEGIDPIAGKRFIDEQAGRVLKLAELQGELLALSVVSIPTIQAINPVHQKTVNKYLIADRKHVDLTDSFDRQLESAETPKQFDRLYDKKERQTDKTYQRCYDLFCELPIRERQNIDKQYIAHYGYDCQMGVN